ncbi:MAG: fibronectin type III domain-containing protein [Chitinophagaceae bacterium]|nr:fibronectin type III domain-containing protein [Chitinophagaceae bacterium]
MTKHVRFNRLLARYLLFFIMLALGFSVRAQVSTTVTMSASPIAGSPFASLADAITAVNGLTITGPVVVTASAGSETNPAGGYSITATGSSTNTITIQGAGSGSTIITAPNPAGTAGALTDAIFKIIGGDYITISGFGMNENAANTTTAAATNNMVEWGVALLYASTTNGAQNCTIQNNAITLNRTYQNTFGIYSNSTHSTTSVTTSATATTSAGGNSGLKIYSNTISNVNLGIVVIGPTAIADVNTGVEIGGAGLGNTISNFGTTGTFSGFANVSGTVNGILIRNSNGFVISNNSITSSAGGVTAGTLNGIQVAAASSAPTATFTNNINGNSIALQSAVAAGAINGITYPSGSASTTSSVTINNNNFTQLNHSVTASGTIIGINLLSTNLNTSINNNTFTNITTGTTGSFTFIVQSFTAATNGTKNTNGNSIVTAFNKTGAGGTVTFIVDNGSSTTGTLSTCQNNNFSNGTITGATTLTGISYTDGGTAPSRTVTGNTISNWTGGTSAINCMNFTYWNGTSSLSNNTVSSITSQGNITGITIGATVNTATSVSINNNSISNLSSTGTGGTVIGISCTNTSTLINIYSNSISGLSSTGASAVSGISIGGANTTNVYSNSICNLEGSNASSTVNGVLVSSGSTVNVYNNRIGDLRVPNANAANPLNGINITGGTTINVHFNTVLLSASSSGAIFGSSAVSASSTPTLTLRNNIFVNTSTPNSTGVTVAYRRSSATLTSYGSLSNNNLFYAGSPSASYLIFTDGTNNDQTLNNFKLRVSARDAASVSENPNFLSTACGNSNFLKINTTTATQIEGAAVTIAGITDDFEGDIRNVSTPDIGADEFSGIAADLTGPSITYTALSTTACTSAISLSASITDASGVNITAGTKPRLYYKKSGDADTYVGNTSADNGWKYVEASNASSPFNFTFDYSLLQSAVVPTDVIQYFVIAADNAGTPNIGMNNGIFTTPPTSVALTAGAFPLSGTINSFNIINVIPTSVTIGASGTYPTLTGTGGLFEAINNNALGGNTVATIIDASITEPGTVALNAINYGCATYTLTIKPQTTAVLTGSIGTGALIKLNGADNVIIDGSNSGGTDRSLTIQNTTTATSGNAVIWLASPASGNGSNNNVIKNCIIEGNSSTTTFTGIHVGGNTTIGISTAGLERNNNNTIQNNLFRKSIYGVTMFGFVAISPDLNNVITQNNFGTATTGEGHSLLAINADRQNNLIVSYNEVQNVRNATNTSSTPYGGIRLLDFKNGICNNNNVHDLAYTGTSTPKIYGIAITSSSYATVGNPSNALVYNNTVSRITSTGTSAVWNLTGILASAGYGDKFYHNTVHLTGQLNNSSTGLSAAFANGDGNITSSCINIDVRNNIFNVEGSSLGGNVWAYYSFATSLAGSTLNYNVLRCAGTGATNNTGRFNATNYTTLAAWQTASAQDANSIETAPVFLSNTDLHLDLALNAGIDNLGTPIAAVTTDMDGVTRSASTPDIGADEFTVSGCTGAFGGTASGNITYCGSGTPTITASGYSFGIGSSYQWMFSTNSADYPAAGTPISGQTNPSSLTTGLVNTTSYYWLQVNCTSGTSTDYSNMVTITVNPIGASISGPNTKCVNDPAVTLSENGGLAVSWSWAPGGESSQSISVNPSASTVYTVTTTTGAGCTSSATYLVTVNPNPSGLVASASQTTICNGTTIDLSVNTINAPTNLLTEDFETGASGWSFIDSSSTGTNLAQQIWHIQSSPYTDATGSATFSSFSVGGSNFAYSNPDAGASGSQTRTFMESPSFSTEGYSGNATLSFTQGYRYWSSSSPVEQVKVQITSDNGATWTDLVNYSGNTTTSVVGVTTNNLQTTAAVSLTIPNGFMNQPSVKLRWRYLSNWGYYWIVDDIAVTGTPIPYTYSWTSTPSGFTSTSQNPTGLTPSVNTTYEVTVAGVGGCTASTTVDVIVNQPTSNTTSASACDSYTWSVNGMTYTQSGTYTAISTNAAGCPHTETLNLTINNSTSNTTSASACDSYTWSVNGMTYTQSGTYTATSTNAAGCPHTETLNLTINNSTSNTSSATACDSYTWSVDGMTYSTGGTFSATTTNAAGCPHTETLNLTINNSTSNTTTASACDSYTWSANGMTYTQSGTFSATTTNAAGCPHVETLILTMGNSTSNTTSITACDSYTWSATGVSYTSSGTYFANIYPNPYCSAGSTTNGCNTGDEYISNVTMGSINNNSACETNMYADYNYISTNVVAGSSYPITVTNANHFTGDQVTVWVDWNQNGLFTDVDETYTLSYTPNLGSGNITVPATAMNGNTKMRIRLNYVGTMDACGSVQFGEVEDYNLSVSGGIAAPTCPHVEYLNLTINNSTSSTTTASACDSYTWSLNGMTYTTSGTYTMTSTNALGCTHTDILNLTINAFNVGASNPNPELLYYKFDGTGTTVPNLALTPPSGTANATIMGSITQGSTGQSGGALNGSGITGTTDHLNTGWATNLGNSSWTISFWSQGISTNSTLYYVFGDVTAGSFRCFTNGVAGSNNWILRGGGLIDVPLPGGALNIPTVNTFVYDAVANNVKAYLNGVLVNTVNQGALNITGSGPFKVMGYTANQGAPVGGKLDEFRVYNRALNAAEVAQLVSLAPPFAATATPATICAGSNTTLEASGGMNVVSSVWNPGNISGMNVTVNPSATTIYTVTGTDNNGCTGTTTVEVTVNPAAGSSVNETACDTYTWAANSTTYTQSGTYIYSYTNSNSCIVVDTLNLTINNSTSNTSSASACDSYTWSVDGMTYSTGGTFSATTTNAAGCPHTETLNLTINNSTSGQSSATACDSYTWSCNGMTYTQSGTYTCASTNAAGCPHTETLTLTINNSTSNTSSATACDSYTWSVDGMTYSTGGTFSATTTNAAGCPHTETLNLTINNSTSSTSTATACDSYTWSVNGLTYTQSGTYTFVTPAAGNPAPYCTASATCDEYISNVTMGAINNTSTCSGGYADYTAMSTAVTAGSSYSIDITNGLHYTGDQVRAWVDWNQDGDFADAGETTLITYANPVSTGTIAVPAGAYNGNTRMRIRLTYTGAIPACGVVNFGETEDYTLTVSGGVQPLLCPHTDILVLTINNSTSNASTATACDTYTWAVNGNTYTQSGTYTATSTNAAGCTHTETLYLTITPSTTNTTSATACDSYTWSVNGMTYTASGTYTNVTNQTTPAYCSAGATAFGCTSGDEYINNVTIGSINNNSTCGVGMYEDYTSLSTAVSAGSSYAITVGNANHFSGDQVHVWCDWNQNGSFSDPGENYVLGYTPNLGSGTIAVPNGANNGNTRMRIRLNWSGVMDPCGIASYGEVEDYTLVVSGGSSTATVCTHTEILNLTINNSTSNTSSATACDSYTWSVDGMTYTQSGTYTATSTNAAGCPHTETLNLTINNSTSGQSSATACDSYMWSCDGMTYTQSGTYTCNSTNAAGCPHVETLTLTINASTSNTSSATACDSYTWSVNGMTYTQSGTYTATSTNTAGCPHTETLNLTINNSTSNTSSATACDSYTWSVDGMTYTQSGTYTATSTNAAGCPHTETLNLTINNSTSGQSSATACDSYTWSCNGMTYTQSGTYTCASTNAAGCPHTETLTLTINASTSNTSSATACDSYMWSVDGMTYTASGTYTATSTNAAGCPHTETLNLTINASTSSTTSATACDSYTWSVNGVTYTQSGTYTFVTPAAGNPAPYCAASATCDEHISNVTIGAINNSSTCSGGYADYTAMSTAVTAGSSYSIDVTNGNHYSGDQVAVWVDWNQDGDFADAGEAQSITYANPISNGSIAVPANATNGNTRMRVRITYTGAIPACGSVSWGETEDYTLTVSGGIQPLLCPHTDILVLTINNSTSNASTATACDTYTWTVNGMTYTQSGTYTATSTNAAGCTHTEILYLTITPSTTNTTSATACDSYTWSVNGMTYTASGTYTNVTNQTTPAYCSAGATNNGCTTGDEYINNVTIGSINNNSNCGVGMYEDYTSLSTAVSAGSSYAITVGNANHFLGDQVHVWCDWNQNGSFSDPGENYVLVYTPNLGSGTIAVPNGANNGNTRMRVRLNYTGAMDPCGITSFGEVEDYTLVVSGGVTGTVCTHTEILNLTINNSTSNTTSATACDSYTWSVDGMTYTQSGTYTATSTNAAGCPHTETLNLTINNSTSGQSSATACDSYTWSCNGMTYTQSGTYTCTSTNAAGCPHTETLTLTINNSTSNTSSATACDSYTWSVNGMTYTASGTYTSTSTNTAGCPHTETLNLTINNSTSNTTSATACDSYTWSIDGNTYSTGGTYTATSTNAAGCPHTETLNLTINASTSNSTTATACDSYTWSADGMTYSTGGTYTATSTNAAGCPHVETLNLTINNSTSNTTAASACETYTWSIDGMTYTQSGTYTATSTNAAGCPHTETLNLTIYYNTSNTTTTSACVSYTWPIDGMTYTQSGTYTSTSNSGNGCTHTEILILTINQNPVVTAPDVSSCSASITLGGSPAGGIWNLPNPYSGNASSYTYYYTDANGCTGSATGNITTQNAIISNVQASAITGLTALITWTPGAGIPWFEIRYKVVGAGSWNPTVTSSSPNKPLSGLTANTTYTVEVRGFCSTSNPGPWTGTTFTTNSSCGVPTGLSVTNITATTAKLNWTAVVGATFYTVRHRKVGTTTWTTGTSTSNTKSIAGLAANTNYEFQVATHCGTAQTAFSASTTFATLASKTANATMVESRVDFNVYPNPTQGELNVDITMEQDAAIEIHLMDMSGRIVKQIQTNAYTGVNNITLNVQDLSNGVYTVQVMKEGELLHVTRITKN